jgi:hypothetical protein
MTDTPTDEPVEEMPDMTSFEVTATRAFEMDFSERQLQGMMQRTEADTPEEAIEEVFVQQEVQHVEPEQKLLGADVQVNGPSND